MRQSVPATSILIMLCVATSAFAADARFVDGQGNEVGTATLREVGTGVIVRAELQGLSEGWHGFHIHETGKCEGPDFKSAGGHFSPADAHHGFESEDGPHAGDLPNIYAGSDGMVKVEAVTNRVSLDGENGLLDDDGATLMIHAGPDDYRTDPSGASGGRIACAVIEP